MLRVGLDITVLYHAVGGVYTYWRTLVQALQERVVCGQDDVSLTLIDYAPAHWGSSRRIDGLFGPAAPTHIIDGPAQPMLSRSPMAHLPLGRPLAERLDVRMGRAWGLCSQWTARRRYGAALRRLDVLHGLEVIQPSPGAARQVATVFDVSPVRLPEHHTPENIALFSRKMRHVCAHASQVIAISEHARGELLESYPALADRVVVVPLAAQPGFGPVADPATLAGIRRRYGIPTAGYLLYVGTLEPRKNLVRLIDAYAHVRAAGGDSVPPLVLAGPRGWREGPIFDAVERWGVGRRVIFPGYVAGADLPALYSGAALFVYPSLYEGFGLPVLESMACGAPVVTSSVSALPEVAGDAALLVDPTDTGALAAAIQRLLDDQGLRDRLRTLGLLRAARYTWRRTADETLAVYRTAARPGGTSHNPPGL